MSHWTTIAIASLACVSVSAPISAKEVSAQAAPWRSATKARDIGGFELGMHIRDVNKISPVENLGNDDYKAVKDGISYDFGVTALGRVYRISSEQPLGRFQIDRKFIVSLTAKLVAKFGPLNPRSAENYDWEIIENVRRTSGQVSAFKTNWASAYVSGGGDGVTLYVKMLDFRYLWQDEANLNRAPRDNGIEGISL